MGMRVVLDTNIIVGAMLRDGGAARAVLRLCLQAEVQPIIGVALFAEMEDVLSRADLFRKSKLTHAERQELFSAFLSVTQWVPIYYTWRPNLRDEADNHVVDLAVAGNADYIVTQNERDFAKMELQFPQLKLATAAEFMELWRKR
ncbi:putative toxin-antitoxin system toxin component, PIN family [Rhodobacterales bacterium LSUCC0031]|nr:putative toxin-antitoxin system toxin component, PIN family [Rhodobacterales bacterium LSUCC0031]